jgi:hypothetical protein
MFWVLRSIALKADSDCCLMAVKSAVFGTFNKRRLVCFEIMDSLFIFFELLIHLVEDFNEGGWINTDGKHERESGFENDDNLGRKGYNKEFEWM